MTPSLVELEPFTEADFDTLISWVDSQEMLMQFAGPGFSYPLTKEQLAHSQCDVKRYAFRVLACGIKSMIGYGEVYLGEQAAYLGRLLIADQNSRGMGLGGSLVNKLLEFAFMVLNQQRVALNVFDWNKAAIRCYEKAGFVINPNLKAKRFVNGQNWTALNLTIARADWIGLHQTYPER